MAIKTPIKATFTGSDVTGLAEFQSGDSIGVAYGGTGANTLTGLVVGNGVSAFTAVTDGTNGQVLTTDGAGGYTFQNAGASNVAALTDVTLTNLADGEILKYDSATSAWINATDAGGIALTDLSVTDAGGDGSLSYNNTTGVFTYTGPSATEVRSHFTAGTGVSLSSGQISIGQDVSTSSNVIFNQVTANLIGNVSGNVTGTVSSLANHTTDNLSEGVTNLYYTDARTDARITAASLGDIGDVDLVTTPQTDGQTIVWDAATLTWVPGLNETVTSLTLAGNLLTYINEAGTLQQIDLSAYLDEDSRAIASGSLNASTGLVTFTRDDASTFTLDLGPLLDDTNLVTSVNGQAGVVTLNTDNIAEGATNLYYTNARVDTHLNTSAATTNYVLSWNGSDYVWVDNAGYTNSDVDTHLNTSTATASDMLVWNGSDYAWQAAASQNSLVSSNTTHTITLEDTGELTLQSNGALVNDTAALTTTTANQTIDTFAVADYRTAKYMIQGISSSDVHATEVLITHDDSTVYTTEYATIFSTASLFTVTASISSGNVVVTVTPTNAGTTIDYTRMCLIARSLGIQGDLSTQSGTEDLQSGSGTVELN